jgi:hypothetical protein
MYSKSYLDKLNKFEEELAWLDDAIEAAGVSIQYYHGRYKPRHGEEIFRGWEISVEQQDYAENAWKPDEEPRKKCDSVIVGLNSNFTRVLIAPVGNDVHYFEMDRYDLNNFVALVRLHNEFLWMTKLQKHAR